MDDFSHHSDWHEGGGKTACPDAAIGFLRLHQFRNYLHLDLSLNAKTILLTGPNGAGKTNLMEAVSLLCYGRGLRRAGRMDMGWQPASDSRPSLWSVYAEVTGPSGSASIGTGLQAEAGEIKRKYKINQAPATQNALSDYITLSWLTPQMDGLFLASPSSRRRFLDRLALAFDPAHSGRLQRYEKAWRERNIMLSDQLGDEKWLRSVEQILAETGVAIMATRAEMIADINQTSQKLDTCFPQIKARLTGEVAQWLDAGVPAIDIEDRILGLASERRAKGDMAMPGAHEADFVLDYKGRSAEFASTGEQKALLVSMILAHAKLQDMRLKRPPILLLDDVAAHLDAKRRQELFDLCTTLSSQIWYSGADPSVFNDLSGDTQHLAIENGTVQP